MIENLKKMAEELKGLISEKKTDLSKLMAQMSDEQRKDFQSFKNEVDKNIADLNIEKLQELKQKYINKWQRASQA